MSKWRIGIAELQSARFDFSIKICINHFVRGLPHVPAFTVLHAELSRRLEDITQPDDYGAFILLTEKVLELDATFRLPSSSLSTRPPRAPPAPALPPPSVTAPSSSPSDPSSRVPKKDQTCSNCRSRGLRSIGHTELTCFQPGGGMEGRREEYLSNKGRIHAMIAECLENAILLPDQPLPPDDITPTSPIVTPMPDSDYLPPLANLSVTHFLCQF